MLCYRDRTFCTNPDCKCPPGRRLTDEVIESAKRWWGGDDPPIAMGNLCSGREKEDAR